MKKTAAKRSPRLQALLDLIYITTLTSVAKNSPVDTRASLTVMPIPGCGKTKTKVKWHFPEYYRNVVTAS